MKIRGFFRRGALEAAYVTVTISISQLNLVKTIEFLIDTGASRTTISDRDAITLRLDYSKLEKSEEILGIGGEVETYTASNPKLIFVTDKGTEHTEILDKIYVLKHRVVDEKIKRIPSILGRDILNKYRLIFDRKDGTAIITDERD